MLPISTSTTMSLINKIRRLGKLMYVFDISGYSSPSAGLHSKESSPCGSKIPSPPHSLEQERTTASSGENSDQKQPLSSNR